MSDFMSDFELIHRTVLASAKPVTSSRIRLAALPEGTVLQVFGGASDELAGFCEQRGLSLRANGPGQWYLIGDGPLAFGAFDGLSASLPPGHSIVDQSHGRVRMFVEGPSARDVLAKGTGLDLATLGLGDATTTLVGHIAAHITRSAPDRFELMPLRGFAENLWHDLEAMAAEFAD
jgi:sarcosine oxidase subunit gamma